MQERKWKEKERQERERERERDRDRERERERSSYPTPPRCKDLVDIVESLALVSSSFNSSAGAALGICAHLHNHAQ